MIMTLICSWSFLKTQRSSFKMQQSDNKGNNKLEISHTKLIGITTIKLMWTDGFLYANWSNST